MGIEILESIRNNAGLPFCVGLVEVGEVVSIIAGDDIPDPSKVAIYH